jgi:SAM-dependent methyltransferase
MPLARGWRVTAVEESRPSIEVMRSRFVGNDKFEAVYDPDGSLSILDDRRFSVVFIASVLHHIPDYLETLGNIVENHLEPNGTLITVQDPLWYPGQPRLTTAFGKVAYASWRITKAGALQGIKNRLRRSRGKYDESNPADMVEYHVVRQGVDQNAIERLLAPKFESVAIETYWSTQSHIWQQIGERAHLTNTFAVYAVGLLTRSP